MRERNKMENGRKYASYKSTRTTNAKRHNGTWYVYLHVCEGLSRQPKKMSFPPTTKLSPRFWLALIGRCMLRVVVRCTEEQGLLKKSTRMTFLFYFLNSFQVTLESLSSLANLCRTTISSDRMNPEKFVSNLEYEKGFKTK